MAEKSGAKYRQEIQQVGALYPLKRMVPVAKKKFHVADSFVYKSVPALCGPSCLNGSILLSS